MSTANLDHQDLSAALVNGVVNEDVMQSIFDISPTELKFTDMIGSGRSGNRYKEWTIETLETPALDNAVVDGADITQDDSKVGTRVGNQHQISVKGVKVSTRANASDSVGGAGKVTRQLNRRMKEVKRDVEATMLSNNASVADDGNTTPGQSAGLQAWIETNVVLGATGVVGGFNTGTSLVDSCTPGTKAAMSETSFKDLLQSIYENGGDPTVAMSVPSVIRLFSEFMFTDTARAASMVNDDASNKQPMTTYGATNYYVGDFSTVKLVANRIMQEYAAGEAAMFILDTEYLSQSFLVGYSAERLAKTGLAENWQITADWTLCVHNEAAQGCYNAIDTALAMVQ